MLRLVREDFSIVGVWELGVPFSDELSISFRQFADELVVRVYPVVHAVVAD